MSRRMTNVVAILALVALGTIAACTRAEPDPTAPEALLGPRPSSSETAVLNPESDAPPSDLDPEVARAIEVRRQIGLIHDLDYVLLAADDPAANSKLVDFPIYPHEEAMLLADQEVQGTAMA